MRKQKIIWQAEHSNKTTLPTMANIEPASGVVLFTDFLKERNVPFSGKAVDIGAGKGRNAVHLAKAGFETYALEYIQDAIVAGEQLARSRGVANKVHFLNAEIDDTWDFEDNFFDIAIDTFASIDVETKAGRQKLQREMLRTLKPGGYALVTVCSTDDEWEKELIAKHPGPEPNSTIWPQNGKFQKDYTEDELREFYKDFEIVELRKLSKPAFKLGREGTATNLWLVLRKPAD